MGGWGICAGNGRTNAMTQDNHFLKSAIFFMFPNLRDEADNHLIELAVAGGADYLITKNTKDFNNAELQFSTFKIIRPERFIQEV